MVISEKVYECGKCGVAHLTPTNRWHDAASQADDLDWIAKRNGLTVEEVKSRLGYATHHPSRDASTSVAVLEASRLCPMDQKPIQDPRATYCSPACRKGAWRTSRT